LLDENQLKPTVSIHKTEKQTKHTRHVYKRKLANKQCDLTVAITLNSLFCKS